MLPIEQIHPLAVHFPIVFVLSLAAFDIVVIIRGSQIGGRGAVANLSAGLAALAGLAATVAYIFGDIAFDIAIAAGTPIAQLELHEELGTATAIVIGVWAIIRVGVWLRRVPLTGGRAAGIAVIEIGIAGLIITTAYFGGQLVYEFGVGVLRSAGG